MREGNSFSSSPTTYTCENSRPFAEWAVIRLTRSLSGCSCSSICVSKVTFTRNLSREGFPSPGSGTVTSVSSSTSSPATPQNTWILFNNSSTLSSRDIPSMDLSSRNRCRYPDRFATAIATSKAFCPSSCRARTVSTSSANAFSLWAMFPLRPAASRSPFLI